MISWIDYAPSYVSVLSSRFSRSDTEDPAPKPTYERLAESLKLDSVPPVVWFRL